MGKGSRRLKGKAVPLTEFLADARSPQAVDQATELMWKAASEGQSDLLAQAIQDGADVNRLDCRRRQSKIDGQSGTGGEAALHMVALYAPVDKAEACLKLLVRAGADVNIPAPLHCMYTAFDLVMHDSARHDVKKALAALGGHQVTADPF